MNLKPDPLKAKREHLAMLMNRALEASFRQGLDPAVAQWTLNRRRDQKFSAQDRDVRSLPESQLDLLIAHYGNDGPRCVW